VEDPPQLTDDQRKELLAWLRAKELPVRIRHAIYWVVALGVISLSAFDGSAHPASSFDVGEFVFLIVVVSAAIVQVIQKLGVTLREWDQVSVARTISRSLVAFALVLGIVAAVLVLTRRWVHIEACRTVGGLETCRGPASPRQVLDMLAWHAANVVPVLDIPHSLEWQRPARSANVVVGASILVVRLFVAIVILGLAKRLWDKWGPGGSRPTVSPSAHSADVARRAPGGPPKAEPATDAEPAAPQAPPGSSTAEFGSAPGHRSRPRRQQSAFRFSGECPGPRESTTVHLIRPDDPLGQLGIQGRPHVSTTVVSTALAAGLYVQPLDLPLLRRGVESRPSMPPEDGSTRSAGLRWI
jgi:hypothetical protein